MVKNFLKDDGEFIVFNGNHLECYIPSFYFNTKLAEYYGDMIRVFGIFNIRAFTDSMKPMKLETLNYPSLITLYPNETKKEELTLLEGDHEPNEYIVAKFHKGSRLMRNKVPKDSSNVELFIDLIIRGKIPTTIPYSQLIHIWLKNLSDNNINLQVSPSVLESMISQLYRNPKNPTERFSQAYGKNPNIGEYAYNATNIRQLCSQISTFTALTFEDIDSMITSSLNISLYNKEEVDSPLEKILKM